MKKLPFFPLLIVTFLIVGAFAVYNPKGKVLSEKDTENHQSGVSGSIKTPEAHSLETAEPKETPEPSETPEAEFESEVEKDVKDGTEAAKIKIRSGKHKFEFQQEGTKFQVESSFPLSVNPTTRELTVTTPEGSRVVAVLPEEAVNNMLANGFVSTTSGVNLETQNDGSLAYHVDGSKNERLLGVVPVSVPKSVIVSAQTGQVIVVNQSVFARILDFLSF